MSEGCSFAGGVPAGLFCEKLARRKRGLWQNIDSPALATRKPSLLNKRCGPFRESSVFTRAILFRALPENKLQVIAFRIFATLEPGLFFVWGGVRSPCASAVRGAEPLPKAPFLRRLYNKRHHLLQSVSTLDCDRTPHYLRLQITNLGPKQAFSSCSEPKA